MLTDSELLQIANDSGFPFQVAVQNTVNAKTSCHGWESCHAEHAWSNPADGQSGFIDLVLQDGYGRVNLVIECKRVRNATWLFFNSSGSAKPSRRCKSWVSHYRNGKFDKFGWHEAKIAPTTPEAQFCAVRGQSVNDKNTMLERVAGAVISSTEALALEERDYRQENEDAIRFYFNAVVTTATLIFAEFVDTNLSVADGTLSEAKFEEVSFVRVRKQFSMRPAHLTTSDWLRHDDPDFRRENTVFVINASRINEFLEHFNIQSLEAI